MGFRDSVFASKDLRHCRHLAGGGALDRICSTESLLYSLVEPEESGSFFRFFQVVLEVVLFFSSTAEAWGLQP